MKLQQGFNISKELVMDLSDIQDIIGSLKNLKKAIEMINSADFDLSELDDEGRNNAEWVYQANFTELEDILSAKGIKSACQDD